MRYTTAGVITSDGEFNSAAQAQGVPAPQPAGSAEIFTVTGLTPGTNYFFGIKAADEANNVSDRSNSPSGITVAIPKDKYEIRRSTGEPEIVVVNTYSNPLVSRVNIFGTTNPATGIGVDFSVSTFPAGASLSKSSETTVNGMADVILKLGNIPAEYNVTATCNSCEPSSNTVTFTCCGKLKNDDFKQGDPRWATHPYNTQTPTYTKTLGKVGCALSVLATLINYYSETFPELTISATNPKSLNDIAENQIVPKMFDKKHNLDFMVTESTNASNAKIDFITDAPYDASEYTIAGLRNLIDSDLKNKLPVIATVLRKKDKEVWKHFVLIVGKCDNKYVVSDPGSLIGATFIPEDTITLKDDSTFGPLSDIRRFKKK
jgi:hypothetical protein